MQVNCWKQYGWHTVTIMITLLLIVIANCVKIITN